MTYYVSDLNAKDQAGDIKAKTAWLPSFLAIKKIIRTQVSINKLVKKKSRLKLIFNIFIQKINHQLKYKTKRQKDGNLFIRKQKNHQLNKFTKPSFS